jgi:hypothetical protein
MLELAESVRTDGLHQTLQIAQPWQIRVAWIFFLQLAQALLEGLQAGGRRGEERLFQNGAEQHGALAGACAFTGQFELGQGVEGEILRRTGVAVQAEDFALREVLLHLLAHIFLEAADEEVGDVIAAVVGLVAGRQHCGVEHAHQAGEALFPAVVRGGGEQDQGV